ncbi:MAG: HAD family hydrolase [Candidatus Bathyarchaeota archaeon]|nr:HAD family hydrolase [Candidatus Bathyarchaeota archaeon]
MAVEKLISLVTFDFWNTLFSDMDYTDSRVQYLSDTLGERGLSRDYEKIKGAYLRSHEYAHRVGVNENHRYVTCWERVGRILGEMRVELPRKPRQSIVKKFEETVLEDPPSLVEDAREVLQELSSEYKMGIICDTGFTPGRVLRIVLEGADILGFFGCTVFSDEVGYNKPHRIMFETALKVLGGKPSEGLHIGDLLQTDVAGAKAVGMKAVWLNKERSQKSIPYAPNFQISKLTHLPDILRNV